MERKIVVVAPTFNEEENIGGFITAVLEQHKKLPGYDLCVLISDSHSPDRTGEIVQKIAAGNKKVIYLDVQKRGLGLGLSRGLDYAVDKLGADLLVTMEADLSNDPKQLPEFIRKLETADLVIGSRYSSGGKITNWSWWRKALSLGANLALRLIAWAPNIHEFTNLYRAFKKEVWRDLRRKVSVHVDWLFVPAFLFEALETNLRVAEQPIVYFDRFGGRSKMHTLSYAKNLLHYALRYRIKKSASFFKFLVVGTMGFIINTVILVLGVQAGLSPSASGPLGAELAILSNFLWNNLWTFSDRKLTSWNQIPVKFIQFNVLSFGSVVIQYIFLKAGEIIFGMTRFKMTVVDLPVIRLITWYFIFYCAGVGVGLIWNFVMYSKVIWKKSKSLTR